MTAVGDAMDALDAPPMVVCEQSGKIVRLNAAWTQLCGYTQEEMVGCNLSVLQGPATDMASVHRLLEQVAAQRTSSTELVNYDRSSRPFKHTVRVTPLQVPDGAPPLFQATSEAFRPLARTPADFLPVGEHGIDLDEMDGMLPIDTTVCTFDACAAAIRVRADEGCGGALLAMTGVPRSISMPRSVDGGGMVVLTQPMPPFAVTWASAGWLDVCGFAADEIVGRTLSAIQGAATDRVAVGRLMEAVRTKRPVEGLRLINYSKKNRPFSHTLSITPVRDGEQHDGPLVMFRATSVDVCVLNSHCAFVPFVTHVPEELENEVA